MVIALEEARRHVLERCPPAPAQRVALADAHGLVLAEAIVATEAVPPFANTAMDGFALRASDTTGATDAAPVSLVVVETLRAGHATDRVVQPGQAVRIMTGAPMPDGADAVVMVERTRVQDASAAPPGDERVEVLTEVAPGNHVRAAGDDLRVGDEVFSAGTVLGAGHLGVLASIGVTTVLAHPRPRVGVLSTGDELVQGDAALAPGQIRDSNRITLLALVAASGFEAVDLGCLPDDEATISQGIADGAATCDALISSGGVSMGDFDLVKVVLDRLGEMRWMQIAIKPAKPFAFGLLPREGGADRRVPMFGLPGNPVSSMVSFELLARPALRQMMGCATDQLDRPRVVAVADDALTRRPDGKTHFARVRLAYDHDAACHRVRVAGGQGSHHLTAMAQADALAVLPDGDTIPAGARVEVIPLAG